MNVDGCYMAHSCDIEISSSRRALGKELRVHEGEGVV